jgi:hypothetical protein
VSESTEDLIAKLSRDVPSVRTIPSLSTMAAWTLASSAPLGLALVLWAGVRSDLLSGEPPELWAMTAASLVLFAAGGLLAALAGPVPGRQREEQVGSLIAVAGALVAAVALTRLFGVEGSPFGASDLRSTLSCTGIAFLVALPPLACTTWLQSRTVPRHRHRMAALAGASSVALAGVVVHYWCRTSHPFHLVFGHAIAPLLGAGLFVLASILFWRLTQARGK